MKEIGYKDVLHFTGEISFRDEWLKSKILLKSGYVVFYLNLTDSFYVADISCCGWDISQDQDAEDDPYYNKLLDYLFDNYKQMIKEKATNGCYLFNLLNCAISISKMDLLVYIGMHDRELDNELMNW